MGELCVIGCTVCDWVYIGVYIECLICGMRVYILYTRILYIAWRLLRLLIERHCIGRFANQNRHHEHTHTER